MNFELQDLLARRADGVEPPTYDPHAVMARAERRIRRRNRITAAGAALALAVTMVVSALALDRGSDSTLPVDRPDGDGLTRTPATRPITYGQGQTLHLGTREIDTGLDFLSVDVTDNGAALTTIDGGIWFTDGETVERIGNSLALRVRAGLVWGGAGRPRGWVVSDTAGSLLAWLEFQHERVDRPELVVYDSAVRAVLARVATKVSSRNSATALAIAGRRVFVTEDAPGSGTPESLLRYDLETGVLDRVEEADVTTARREASRALVVGTSADNGTLIDWDGDGVGFAEALTVQESRLEGLFDPHTGEEVELRVPRGYEAGVLWVVQWLDDDRFTLISGNRAPVGDLLVCQITDGRCDVLLERSSWVTEPLLPGHGGVGAELAMMRAMQSVLETRNGG
jgi:hypothetical protein